MADAVADEIIRRAEKLFGGRGIWENHWTEIAERVWPDHGLGFNSRHTPGEKRTDRMVDATAANALVKFAAAMESMLTPRNSKWHRLVPSDDHLMKNREVRLWFEQVADILFKYRYSPRANYASQQHECYMGLGAFGTGALFVDELVGQAAGLRYKSIHLGEICFLENHQGVIDSAYRKFRFSARQAIQRWGERVPEQIRKPAEKNPEQEFEFIHAVTPREDRDPNRADAQGMAFASQYVSCTGKVTLQEGGYRSFPYAISRYVTAAGEVYGRSPAMLALPAIKTLNEQKRTVLKQGHRTVDPVLLAHDDGVLDSFSLKPGAINYGGVNADGRQLVHTLPVGNIAIGKDLMDDERLAINDAFLVNLFQIMVDSPRMTATEVIERTREKGMLLSPTIGRQQSEALGPQIERELDLLSRQIVDGRPVLPPMPPLLMEARGEYQIQYDSPLSRAQRAEEAAGLMRSLETVLNVVNITQSPEPLDHYDWDVIVPELNDIQAVPQRWLRSMTEIERIRAERAEQAQAQQAVDAAPAVAGLMKAGQQ